MRIAVDTNVLVYALGGNDAQRQRRALDTLEALASHALQVPLQVFGELFNVRTRKARWQKSAARATILAMHDAWETTATSLAAFEAAMELAGDHGLGIWDATILACAAEAKCAMLLSEDLQEGFTWRDVTVVNPFARHAHPLLAAALAGAPG